jgi:4-amino-4-deoxy-L-arabinose transferase-like glycosyltransferase
MSQTRRDLLWLLFLALAVRLIVAALIPHPGYMDAAYYAAGAVRMAQGSGLNEPFLWHYLDDPAGLPHPGFLYWMPLSSLLAIPFAALFPGSFFALQLPFALLSALLPFLSYAIAWQTSGVRRHAWAAGLLTIFSGFFFPYWTLPEAFALFALFGGLTLWFAGNWRLNRSEIAPRGLPNPRSGPGSGDPSRATLDLSNLGPGRWLLVGVLIGLAHLTRADGILLLPVVILALLPRPSSRTTPVHCSLCIVHCALIFLGYLLVMTPWFVRNLVLIGAPLSPAGTKTLWLTNYDDLFCYGCDLSLRSYLAWGWPEILRSKLWAAGVNLQRFLAEDCMIFLFPFVIVGLYRLRRRLPFILALIYLFLVYSFHSFAFTFPGPHGGFFHASAPALPFIFAAAMVGLDEAVGWVARWRRWNRPQAQTVFATAVVVGALALSGYAAMDKVPAWRNADAVYREAGAWLDAHNVPDDTVIMVGNPPGFWYHTHRPAVVVPNGDVETLLAAADRYGARYVLLDRNRPAPLAGLYTGESSHPRLWPVEVWGEGAAVLYEVRW